LVATDLPQGDRSGAVAMGLLDPSGSRSGFAGRLGGKLLPRRLSSSGLASGLLGTSHFDRATVAQQRAKCFAVASIRFYEVPHDRDHSRTSHEMDRPWAIVLTDNRKKELTVLIPVLQVGAFLHNGPNAFSGKPHRFSRVRTWYLPGTAVPLLSEEDHLLEPNNIAITREKRLPLVLCFIRIR
jgi:hypothetical protein